MPEPQVLSSVIEVFAAVLLAAAGGAVGYRVGKRTKREDLQRRFESFYETLQQCDDQDIVRTLKIDDEFAKHPKTYVLVAWHLQLIEAVFHNWKSKNVVGDLHSLALMQAARQKYLGDKLALAVLANEGFDAEFAEQFRL